MRAGASLTYLFEDEDWLTKTLIGVAVGLIPVIGSFLQMGFALEATKRTIGGIPTPLPEWDNWGNKLVRGLISGIILFVYFLPIFLILGCPFAVILVARDS